MSSVFSAFLEAINQPFGAITFSILIISLPLFVIMRIQTYVGGSDLDEKEERIDFHELWFVVFRITLILIGVAVALGVVLGLIFQGNVWLILLLIPMFLPMPFLITLALVYVYFSPGTAFPAGIPAFICSLVTRGICCLSGVAFAFYLRFFIILPSLEQNEIVEAVYLIVSAGIALILYAILGIHIVKTRNDG